MAEPSYASYTRETPEFIKGIAHWTRLRDAARILDARPEDTVLDYGCGDGHLMLYLLGTVPAGNLCGYEPDPLFASQMDPSLAEIEVVTDIDTLLRDKPHHFSLVACLEVCEHLSPEALEALFANIERLAAPGARVVFGVPLETGLSGFFKNLYRLGRGRRQGATVASALRSLFALRIERTFDEAGWTDYHIGFDDKAFRRGLARFGMTVVRTDFLPFPPLRHAFNNEIYLTCRTGT